MIDSKFSIHELNMANMGNMGGHLGIEFTSIGEDHLEARMPVDRRTVQPIGILNGGASAALAETVGSLASYLSLDRTQYYSVGLEIKCNHIKSVRSGFVYARATFVHIGRTTHVWQIRITDEDNKLVALSTLTMQIMKLSDNPGAIHLLEKSPLKALM